MPRHASYPYRPTLDFIPVRKQSPGSPASVSGIEDSPCDNHAECTAGAGGEEGHTCPATEHVRFPPSFSPHSWPIFQVICVIG